MTETAVYDLHTHTFYSDGALAPAELVARAAAHGVNVLALTDHDVTDEHAAYKLADAAWPGNFGIFYQAQRPTKNANEARLIADHRAKVGELQDWQILQKSFDRLK